MSNPLEKHLRNGLADFEGLRISGSLPLKQEVLNELIAHVLEHGVPTTAPSAPPGADASVAPAPTAPLDATLSAPTGAPTEPRAKPDVNQFLKRVKRAEVRFENGRAVVDFEISV